MILELTRSDALDQREFAKAHLACIVGQARAKIAARGTRALPGRDRAGRFVASC